MEVSSKHMNKMFRVRVPPGVVRAPRSCCPGAQIVVEPKIRCGVKPCMSGEFRVYAKKTPGKARPGEGRGAHCCPCFLFCWLTGWADAPVSESKRVKAADMAGPAPYS
jgi:hypothetical protein